MSSTIQNKTFFPIDNWVVRRELSLPLPPENSSNSKDFSSEYPTVPWWEKILFRMYTGLNLPKVRIYKFTHSPRSKQLAANGICHIQITAQLMRQNGVPRVQSVLLNHYCDLECYLVDRELSIHIKDVASLKEIFDNKSVIGQCLRTEAEGYYTSAERPRNAYGQLTSLHPIEAALCSQVDLRLQPLLLNARISYNESFDTFQLEPDEEGEPQEIDGCINKSLGLRLAQDIERRKEDPNCRLFFVYNEIFEAQLKKRIQFVNRCWLATTLVVSLVGVVFFCRVANRIK